MNKTKCILLIGVLSCVSGFCGCGHRQDKMTHAGADSTYTADYIRSISFSEPERALALLDTAEAEQLLSPFDISDLRCGVYHNGLSDYRLAFFHARKAYKDPEARKDPYRFLSLLWAMADESHTDGNYTGSIRYCTEGLDLARETGDVTSEASFLVTYGLNLLEQGLDDEAFLRISDAVELLEKEAAENPCYDTWDGLYYALGMKLAILWEKDRYGEALSMRPLIDKTLRGLEESEDTPEDYMDMRRGETDVIYCCIAYAAGDRAAGDSLLRGIEANPYSSTTDGEYIRIPCLIMAERYDEALHYLKREKRMLQATTDTLNWDYIDPHLQMEFEAYQGKGDWQSASRVQVTMRALADSLRKKEKGEEALELARIYETEEKEAEIKEERNKSRLAWTVTGFVCLLLVVGGCLTAVILRKNRDISRRNLALVAQVKEHLANKKELDGKTEENLALRRQLELARAGLERAKPEAAHKEVLANNTPPEADGDRQADADRILFERIAREIRSRQLFRDPDFSRTEMLRIIPVPQNKFAGLFKQFAGMSFTAYIRNMRLEYASELFIEHPDWTTDAVIRECGMLRSSFYAFFIKKFGVNPDEFRRSLKKNR